MGENEMSTINLFGNRITPACTLCESCIGNNMLEENTVLCVKKGIVAAGYSCKAFRYDPLRRIPRSRTALLEDQLSSGNPADPTEEGDRRNKSPL